MPGRTWIKLHRRWYETTSHLELGPVAFQTGPHLLMLADLGEKDGEGGAWLVRSNGKPWTTAGLARVTRWPEAALGVALDELVDAGTMDRREDGAWGFPNFDEHQETKWAGIKRAQREKEKEGEQKEGEVEEKGVQGQSTGQSKDSPTDDYSPEVNSMRDRGRIDAAMTRLCGDHCPAEERPHKTARERERQGDTTVEEIETIVAKWLDDPNRSQFPRGGLFDAKKFPRTRTRYLAQPVRTPPPQEPKPERKMIPPERVDEMAAELAAKLRHGGGR